MNGLTINTEMENFEYLKFFSNTCTHETNLTQMILPVSFTRKS